MGILAPCSRLNIKILQGAHSENCKDRLDYAIVTKKNTQTSNLSVLSVVCNYGSVIISILAYCINKLKLFAVCHE